VSASLARGYPVLVDATLVLAGVAVLWLHDAGLPSRLLAWLSLLLLLAAAATADALRAAGTTLPDSYAPIIAAVVPWAIVVVGFALLLAMLRHARLRVRAAAAATADYPPLRPLTDSRAPGDLSLLVRRPGLSGHTTARLASISAEGATEDAGGEPSRLLAAAASAGARAASVTELAPQPEPVTPGDPADGTGAYPVDVSALAGCPAALADATDDSHLPETSAPAADEDEDPRMPVLRWIANGRPAGS
jgi:hypothetical protein